MHRLLKIALLLISLSLSLLVFGQPDSCSLQVSLLTCSPGQELYSTFGHTAIRVKDVRKGMDVVFNYGTFDDSDPYFYVKFTRGIMLYALSVQSFPDFMREYQMERRGVIEQVLDLDCIAKEQLFDSLRINAEEPNRYYNYYFHTDNCTTRARDIIAKKPGGEITFKNILPDQKPTFRQLIHTYLDKNNEPWSKFGIDALMASYLDKKVNNQEAMFLPDYLMKGFDSCLLNHRPIVGKKQTILNVGSELKSSSVWFTPMLLFVLLFVGVAVLSFISTSSALAIMNIFDHIFFLLLGLLGLLILTLWLIRVDTACRNNLNILWALPTHLPVAFVMKRKKDWVRKYFRMVMILTLLLAAVWIWLPQQLNTAVLPLLGIIIIRSYRRSKL